MEVNVSTLFLSEFLKENSYCDDQNGPLDLEPHECAVWPLTLV